VWQPHLSLSSRPRSPHSFLAHASHGRQRNHVGHALCGASIARCYLSLSCIALSCLFSGLLLLCETTCAEPSAASSTILWRSSRIFPSDLFSFSSLFLPQSLSLCLCGSLSLFLYLSLVAIRLLLHTPQGISPYAFANLGVAASIGLSIVGAAWCVIHLSRKRYVFLLSVWLCIMHSVLLHFDCFASEAGF
jgi:hypothetical protein